MLQSLNVSNFALIESMQFQPGEGLNIVTGETGAGKSIMLGALGLVLGNRADATAIYNDEEKCTIEAIFVSKSPNVNKYLKEQDLDEDTEIILRREISKSGKSRAFINDTPVNLNQLKDLGALLIEIHTQNTSLLIKDNALQLSLLDDFIGEVELVTRHRNNWNAFEHCEKRLNILKESVRKAQMEKDFLQFQFDEIENLKPIAGETLQLEERIKLLSHIAEISENSQKVQYLFTEADNSIYNNLSTAKTLLKSIAPYNHNLNEVLEKTEGLMLEIKELSNSLYNTTDEGDVQPNELEQLNSRLALLQLMMRKHQVESVDDLLKIYSEIEQKLLLTENAQSELNSLSKACEELRQVCLSSALELHDCRLSGSVDLCREVMGLLYGLGMPRAQIEIKCNYNESLLNQTGYSQVQILFNANGEKLLPLEKVASGGEISRLNFCFKTILAGKKELPTVVFDEADSGVSGEVALNFGQMMQNLGRHHQIVTITHLPQVAAHGKYHFLVFKENQSGKLKTGLKKLTANERIVNIASMLSGKDPGDAALANAKELLGLK